MIPGLCSASENPKKNNMNYVICFSKPFDIAFEILYDFNSYNIWFSLLRIAVRETEKQVRA